jgi:rubrerythrin
MHPMTRANLEAALAGEALAALRYRLYADRADDEDLADVAALFEDIGREERRDHARRIAGALGVVGSSRANLTAALDGELTEHHRLYPSFAAQARRVGDLEAAALFEELARDEDVHAKRLSATLEQHLGVPAAG